MTRIDAPVSGRIEDTGKDSLKDLPPVRVRPFSRHPPDSSFLHYFLISDLFLAFGQSAPLPIRQNPCPILLLRFAIL